MEKFEANAARLMAEKAVVLFPDIMANIYFMIKNRAGAGDFDIDIYIKDSEMEYWETIKSELLISGYSIQNSDRHQSFKVNWR